MKDFGYRYFYYLAKIDHSEMSEMRSTAYEPLCCCCCCFREVLNEGWIELGTGRDGKGDGKDRAICQHSRLRQMIQSAQSHVSCMPQWCTQCSCGTAVAILDLE